ncbi:MAG TPA: Slp family lipoprotein [Rhodanobacteraceae bacterium]|nr:Slp family lipoprotein [Rhodanobacteraceae bacterium]
MRPLRPILIALIATALAGCASAPIFPATGNRIQATPQTVAATPEHYHGTVLWGGRVIAVSNQADHSEIEIFAFPLDPAQRPQPDDIGGGRFIALMPGYVERMNYPAGTLITLTGELAGVRSGRVGEAAYVFPLVRVDKSHVWKAAELKARSNVHFGIGVGIGIR